MPYPIYFSHWGGTRGTVEKTVSVAVGSSEAIGRDRSLNVPESGNVLIDPTLTDIYRVIEKSLEELVPGSETIALYRAITAGDSGSILVTPTLDDISRTTDKTIEELIGGTETISYTVKSPAVSTCSATADDVAGAVDITYSTNGDVESVKVQIYTSTDSLVSTDTDNQPTQGNTGAYNYSVSVADGSYYAVLTPYTQDSLGGSEGSTCTTNTVVVDTGGPA